jgi:hypothetical protein
MQKFSNYQMTLIAVCVLGVAGVIGYASVNKTEKEKLVQLEVAKRNAEVQSKNYETQAKISAEAATEQKKIEEEAAVKRTQERMNLIPWYKGGENKGKETKTNE